MSKLYKTLVSMVLKDLLKEKEKEYLLSGNIVVNLLVMQVAVCDK